MAVLGARAIRGFSVTGAAGSLVLSHAALHDPALLLELIELTNLNICTHSHRLRPSSLTCLTADTGSLAWH